MLVKYVSKGSDYLLGQMCAAFIRSKAGFCKHDLSQKSRGSLGIICF